MNYIAPTQAETSQEIARRLREARARLGMTRKQLAAASGASERYLAHLEAGSGNPSVEMLLAVAKALDVAPADLLPQGGERSAATAEAAALLRRLSASRLVATADWLRAAPVAQANKAQRLALVGLRGAGKTSLGRALAERLQWPFFEVSKEVERLYGGAIGVLLEINGPSAVARYEAEVLARLYREEPRAVIAAPGAIVADGALYDGLLESTSVVWLEASPEDHMRRVMEQGDLRPMAGQRAAMQDLRAILAARSAAYGRADARLDTSAQPFAETLDRLEALARSLTK
jgi:XRE family transcriptional regulator, aerobic/anaerobic benzoate catabolism transcriptional regulator